mgnify:CR=1 FL=1
MKKLLNRRIALVGVVVIATVAFFSFKSGDDRNFQIAKNLDTFNAIVKELDMFYVDTIDPNKTIREGIDNMLFSLDPYTEYYPEEDQSELEQMVNRKKPAPRPASVPKPAKPAIAEAPAQKSRLKQFLNLFHRTKCPRTLSL